MLPSTEVVMLEGAMYKDLNLTKSKSFFSKPSFQEGLGCNDVICGRHKDACTNIGNRRFRILVAILTQKYIHAPTRAHKSMVIREVVETIHGCGGRFVHQCKVKNCASPNTIWEELLDKQMFDKVGHAFRDMSVSVKEKTDIKNLLSPSQATTSPSESIKEVTDNSISMSTELNSASISSHAVPENKVAVVQEEQPTVNELNRHRIIDDEDDEDFWSIDDLEKCIAASEAISSSRKRIFDNNVCNNKIFQDDFDNGLLQHQWRRESIKSFQCLVL